MATDTTLMQRVTVEVRDTTTEHTPRSGWVRLMAAEVSHSPDSVPGDSAPYALARAFLVRELDTRRLDWEHRAAQPAVAHHTEPATIGHIARCQAIAQSYRAAIDAVPAPSALRRLHYQGAATWVVSVDRAGRAFRIVMPTEAHHAE